MTQDEAKALQASHEQLQTENEALKQRLEAIEQAQQETQKARWQWGKWWAGTLAWFMFGGSAKQSFEKIGKEIKEQQIPNPETLTVAGYHVLWRFVRVTAFAWIATLATVVFIGLEIWLFWKQTDLMEKQNKMFSNQNELVKGQNNLVTQQNLLSEASRRSSLVLLMSNIEDRIAEELKGNEKRQLSEPLIGRIIALCNSMKPYRYLGDGDTLTSLISPERGQMLISLAYAGLDTLTYQSIFKNADFGYADLKGANLQGKYLKGVDLRKANLENATLREADLRKAQLGSVNLRMANLREVNLIGANLIWADLSWVNLIGADLSEAKLDYTRISFSYVLEQSKKIPDDYEIDTTKQKDRNGEIFYRFRGKKRAEIPKTQQEKK